MNFRPALMILTCALLAGIAHAGTPSDVPPPSLPTNSTRKLPPGLPGAPRPTNDATLNRSGKNSAMPAIPAVVSPETNHVEAEALLNEAPSTSPSAAFAAAASGADGSNPYAVIADRNVFHLNPPPPPPTNDVALPPPNIKITGIMSNGKETKALFAIPPKDAKDATQYICLAEGEREGVLELVKIFPEKEECDVVNAGMRMTLSFKNNSYNPPKPVTPPNPGAPGNLPPPPVPNPIPTAGNPMPTAPNNYATSSSVVVAGAQGNSNPGNGRGVIVAGGNTVTPSGNTPPPAPGAADTHQIPLRTLRLTPQ